MNLRIAFSTLLLLAAATLVRGQVKLPPEPRNAALRYWQAFAELKDPPSNKEIQEQMQKVLSGELPWDEHALGGIVVANEIALGIMQRATKLPECDWGVEYTRGPDASIAFVPRAHVLARLNLLRGIRQMAQGQSQAAVDTWIAAIRFAQDLTKGGSLIFSLTAANVLQLEMRTITAEATRGRLSGAQKKQLYAAVHALPDDGFDWGLAWELDSASADLFFAEMQKSHNAASLYERIMGTDAPKGCVPPSAAQVGTYHDYMAKVAAALRQPPDGAKTQIVTLDAERQKICNSIQVAIPNPQRVNHVRAEIVSTRHDLLAALKR